MLDVHLPLIPDKLCHLFIFCFLNCCTDKLILSSPPMQHRWRNWGKGCSCDWSKAKEWICVTKTSVIRAPHWESNPLVHTAICWTYTEMCSRTSRRIVCWKVSIVSCITGIILMHNNKGSDKEVLSQEKSSLAFTGILPDEKTWDHYGTGFGNTHDSCWRNECDTVGAELDPSAAFKCH